MRKIWTLSLLLWGLGTFGCQKSETQNLMSSASPIKPQATVTPSLEPTPLSTPSLEPTMPYVSPSPPLPSVTDVPPALHVDPVDGITKVPMESFVFDDANKPFAGVKIRARSLNSSVPFEATALTDSSGLFFLSEVPAGVTIELLATKPGYTTRRRVEVLSSNKGEGIEGNRYDFGNNGSGYATFGISYNSLSDKPEVITVSPGRNASGIYSRTDFVLTFSEPMDRDSVVDNFEIYVFNNNKLTVDNSKSTNTLTGPGDVNQLNGMRIWDKEAFNVSWNADDTQVTFTFKPGKALPADQDPSKKLDYQIGLNRKDGIIKDKTGVRRDALEKKFKLTDGDFERSYKFRINSEKDKPRLQSINPLSLTTDQMMMRLEYSEPMRLRTLSLLISGGMSDDDQSSNQAPGPFPQNPFSEFQAAANYRLSLWHEGDLSPYLENVPLSSLDGQITWDETDANNQRLVVKLPNRQANSGKQTVRITPPANASIEGALYLADNRVLPFKLDPGPEFTYTSLEATLNKLLESPAFVLQPMAPANRNRHPATSEQLVLTLLKGARSAGAAVTNVHLEAKGLFGPDGILLPSAGLYLYPDEKLNNVFPRFVAKDRIEIEAAETILDPAGNPMDPDARKSSLILN